MKRTEFMKILENRVLVLDGGYGTEFMRRGYEEVPERLVLESPEVVKKLQEEYVEAGANAILTCTFGANPLKLAKSGLEGHHDEIVRRAVKLARGASKGAFVFGDMAPTGDLPYPVGKMKFDDYFHSFKRTASILVEEGVDAIILETFTDILELKAAALAVRDVSDDIFLISNLTFEENGRSLTGTDPMNFAITFNDMDVDAIGTNCSLGPQELLPVFEELAKYSEKPLVVEPDAGSPILEGERIRYPTTPEEFALNVDSYWESGAGIIGSCCGSNPGHTRKISKAIGKRSPVREKAKKIFAISSPSRVVNFDRFVAVGERINPAGRKKLAESMKNSDVKRILEIAREQASLGANALDVNFGVEQLVSREFMVETVASIAYGVETPVSLDVQLADALEATLKGYPGRPLVNSSRVIEAELKEKISLVKKYGGLLVVLSMEEHVPASFEDRRRSIEKGLEIAKEMDFPSDRLVFDPITLAMGAGNDPTETLKTVGYLASKGLKSVVGLSNISFGMPGRSDLNASFLSLAIANGLSAAILNPLDGTVMGAMKASLLLTKRSEFESEKRKTSNGLLDDVLAGATGKLLERIDDLLKAESPLDVIEKNLKPVMEDVGRMYDKGEIFLPQLILAAQTSQEGFEKVQELFPEKKSSGRFVVATVKGDVHDIGKNIVATIVRSAGYDVVDLGRDVPSKEIADAVEKEKPIMLGLSAMMTTTAPKVKEVTEELRRRGIQTPVIAGGASMNEELSKEFGADFYAKTATDAVKALQKIKGE